MESLLSLVVCLLVLLIGVGVLIGWLVWGRAARREAAAARTVTYASHVQWLSEQLDEGPFRSILDEGERGRIREHYHLPPVSPAARQPTGAREAEAATGVAPAPVAPIVQPVSVPAPDPVAPPTRPVSPLAPAGGTPRVTRPEWDPAVLMLYLGAFLVVAAGLVYASYNWADLGSWQKLGLLGAATVAFTVAGWVLLGNERVRQAAETFVAIGALLVPANAIAAYTVGGGEARTALILLLGSGVTAFVYALFSLRPGGIVYSYGTVVAGALAVAAFVPAFGPHWGWGAVTLLLAIGTALSLEDRVAGRWRHLRQPLRRVATTLLPIASGAGVAASATTSAWLLPATLAAATVALAALARRGGRELPAIGATVTGIGTVIGTLVALEADSVAAIAATLLGTAFALIGIGERGPAWMRGRWTRLALHVEAIAGFAWAAGVVSDGNPWALPGVLAIGTAGTVLTVVIRRQRWWLVISGLFGTALWLSLAGPFDSSDWGVQGQLLFVIPWPLVLALAALAAGTGRWSARRRPGDRSWGEPLWLVAGLVAAAVTAWPIALVLDGGQRLFLTLAAASALYALTALAAATLLGRPAIRVAYGSWLVIAAGAATAELPLRHLDRAPVLLAALALLACLPLAAGSRVGSVLRASRGSPIGAERYVFAAAAGLTLLAMLVATGAYIVNLDTVDSDLPGVRWTWTAYLLVYAGIAAALGIAGRRAGGGSGDARDVGPVMRRLPEATFAFAGIAGLLLLRMLTTDLVTWSWAGIGAATALLALAHLGPWPVAGNWYLRRCATVAGYAGLGLGAIAVLANLSRAFAPDRDVNDWGQATVYGVAGLVLLGVSILGRRPQLAYAAFGAFALVAIFATRALAAEETAIVLALIVLAWAVAGGALALPAEARWRAQREPWRTSAVASGGLAVIVALIQNDPPDRDSRAWQVLVIGLVSLAGLLAVDGMVRRDRARGAVASAIAVLALQLQIAIDRPANVQAHTIPLAIYLLALGVVYRRVARTRDLLLGMGAGMLLVPALILAQAEGRFAYVLLAGGFALGLFLAGVLLRLRVPIGAGMLGVTVIVLRILVDAVTALPGWITLLVVGLVLLGGGTVMLVWKEKFRERLDRLQASWYEMG